MCNCEILDTIYCHSNFSDIELYEKWNKLICSLDLFEGHMAVALFKVL